MNHYSFSLALAPVCPDAALKHKKLLEPLGEIIEFTAKQTVCDLRESLDYVFMLLTGKTSHFITNGLDEKLLFQLTPGRIFGNLCYSEGKAYPIRAVALEKTVVLRIPRTKYLELLRSDAAFALDMMDMYADYTEYLLHELDNLSFKSCKLRLMRIYCTQVDLKRVEDGKWYTLASKLTHNELASVVGSARVTISKLINELCEDGFIRIINRRAQVSVEAYEKFLAEQSEN